MFLRVPASGGKDFSPSVVKNRAFTDTVIAYGGPGRPRHTRCRIVLSDDLTPDRDALQVFSSKTRPALGLPGTTRPALAIA